MVNQKKVYRQGIAVFLVLAMLLCQCLILPQKAAAAGTDLYVGYSGKSNNYNTMREAVAQAKSINPSSESERVTIHIAPGTYREQILLETPYVTFVNDEPSKGDVILTWYYGIGYKYYSVGSDGRYNASNAASKSAKAEPTQRWGATVQVQPNANYFRAENIVFENSFNRYVTNEELADGVEPSGSQSITFDRTASGADVQSKAATERGAAMSVEGSYAEFFGCEFYGSQDTLYTGGSAGYFKNCKIEGNTDYIFGKGDYVFEDCELSFKGYSASAAGGYITAAREQTKGYLFYNCDITAADDLVVSPGYLGRPWRDTAAVMFYNTTVEYAGLIKDEGWTSMSGVDPTAATFKEYNTTLTDGTAVDLSSRKGSVISASDAASVSVAGWFSGWTPAYLNKSASSGSTGSTASDAITLCGGWFETAYAEWDSSKIGSNVSVSYKESTASSYTNADAELIRGTRVDIPGLKGGVSYDVKITGSSGSAEFTVTPMTYDRSGYAHWNRSEGVGAYNNDGTLKDGVTVIYVTNENKDTITYNGKTGLYNIFYSAKPSNVCFRLIGDIEVPAGVQAHDGTSNDGSNMLYLQYGENVTIEGIGYDANPIRWGFEMKRSSSMEVRNLYFYQYPDDAVAMNGNSENMTKNVWIHNNSFGMGLNEYAGNGTVDDDKAEGDGTTDMKWAEYITISYNYYNKCHKTSLVGGGTGHLQDWITYHHNWFDGTESRNPRARNAHIHVYNNYFLNNSQYGIGASYNSKIFSEANYFEGVYLPLDTEAMGNDKYSGTIKSYNDKLVNCTGNSVYTAVNNRMDSANISNLVSGGDAYDNFDIDASKIYLNQYTAQSPDDAKTETMEYSGRMQNKVYGSGTVTPGPGTDPDVPNTSDYILDAGKVTVGTFSSDVAVNSVYTIKANAADAVSVTANTYDTADGKHTITGRIFLGGKGNPDNRSIQMKVPAAGTVTVYMMSSSTTAARTVNLLDASGNVIDSVENVGGTDLNAYTLDIPMGGTYYIASNGSGLYVFYAQYVPGTAAGASIDTTKTYMIQNAASGLYMEVENGTAANGTAVQQWGADSAASHNTWTFESVGNGYYMLKSGLGDFYLDVDYGKTEDGTKIGIYANTSANAQYFKLVQNADGSYKILTAVTSDMSALDLTDGATSSGTKVVEMALSDSATQNWWIFDASELTSAIKGDLTDDGIVDAFDLAMMKKDLLKNAAVTKANDMNEDGVLSVVDVAALTKFILNKN